MRTCSWTSRKAWGLMKTQWASWVGLHFYQRRATSRSPISFDHFPSYGPPFHSQISQLAMFDCWKVQDPSTDIIIDNYTLERNIRLRRFGNVWPLRGIVSRNQNKPLLWVAAVQFTAHVLKGTTSEDPNGQSGKRCGDFSSEERRHSLTNRGPS